MCPRSKEPPGAGQKTTFTLLCASLNLKPQAPELVPLSWRQGEGQQVTSNLSPHSSGQLSSCLLPAATPKFPASFSASGEDPHSHTYPGAAPPPPRVFQNTPPGPASPTLGSRADGSQHLSPGGAPSPSPASARCL